MTTSKLALYNAALLQLGERRLASLLEAREPRFALDDAWAGDGGGSLVQYCLSKGQWVFPRRSASLTYSPSVEPEFGPRYAFQHPDDFVKLCEIYSDESFKCPLREYRTEAGFWFADIDTIFVSYVSNDDDYGNDFSLWPALFTEWVGSYLAYKAAPRINREKMDDMYALQKRALKEALSFDAMEQPPKKPTPGEWVRARARTTRLRMGTDGLTS